MDPITVVVVAVVCLAIGFLGGTIVNTLRGEKKTSELPEPVPPAAPAPITPEYLSVAEFLRAKENGPLLIKVDGKVVGTQVELSGDQRASLEDLLLEMRTWLGYKPFTTEQPAFEAMPEALSTSLFGEDNNVFTSAAPVAAASVSTPPFTGSKSIVGQIDDILQDKLASTEYASRRIRLIEKPNQGVVVEIGLQHYEGIDEVPDPEIRTLIHESVAEWELRAR